MEAFKPTMTMYEQMLVQEALYFAQRQVATLRALEISVLEEKNRDATDVVPKQERAATVTSKLNTWLQTK